MSEEDVPEDGWTEILPKTDLQGDRQHYVRVENEEIWSHLRLNIYPDGGIARLRIYGEVRPVFEGDTISARATISDKADTDEDADCGLVGFDIEVQNQTEKKVMALSAYLLIEKKEAAHV